MTNKLDFFKNELEYIKNQEIRKFAEYFLTECVPDYFYTVPASSSGKFHPSYAIGENGLVLHTRAAVMIAYSLFNTDMYSFTEKEKDLIILALLVHDTYKSGLENSGHTVKEHPEIATGELVKALTVYDPNREMLNPVECVFLYTCVTCHMGKWNEIDEKRKMPTPQTEAQKFVHMCDYLASRKFIEIKF